MKKTFKAIFGAAILFALPALLTSCDELFGMEDNPTPSYITINNSDMKLTVGESQTRKAIAAGSAVIVYASADPSIATVDANGTVTGESEGETTITATATGYDGHGKKIYITESKSYNVIVETGKPKPDFALSASTLSLAKSGSGTITVTTNSTGTISAESDKTDVATATVSGKTVTVTAGTTTGEAKITIKITGDNTYAATKAVCTVTVTDAPAGPNYIVCSWDATNKKVVKTETTLTGTYTEVKGTPSEQTWEAGTYVVSGDIKLNKITLNGDANLIIKDDAKLTIWWEFMGKGHKLTIYGQNNGSGKLTVSSGYNRNYSSINSTSLDIHGCDIEITGSTGLSSSYIGKPGITNTNQDITIYDGKVKVNGGKNDNLYPGDGISFTGSGKITLYGGTLEATGGDGKEGSSLNFGYGINSPGTIEINGGTLKATGSKLTSEAGGVGMSVNSIVVNDCTKVIAEGGAGTSQGDGIKNAYFVELQIAAGIPYSIDGAASATGGYTTAKQVGDNKKFEIRP